MLIHLKSFIKVSWNIISPRCIFRIHIFISRLLHIPFRIEDLHSLWIRCNQEACHSQVKRIHSLEVLFFLEIRKDFIKTPLCKRPSAIYILTGFGKKRYRVDKFSTMFPISVRLLICLFPSDLLVIK